jgi:thymidylate synthase
MKPYLDIVERILEEGTLKDNRTGVPAFTISSLMFEHDMGEGFPLLTTKRMPFRLIASELEFFIKGLTDKRWLQEHNNHIWDEWANPKKAPYGHDPESKQRMLEERDLGPIYGWQWRHWGAKYDRLSENSLKDFFMLALHGFMRPPAYEIDYTGRGIDQLENLVNKLKTDPSDRRMLVSAWNPYYLDQMALPSCHYCFQVTVINNTLTLAWNQRSVDTMLGLPFNIASYGLLLHLLAKESGFKEGKLAGFLMDTHIYENQVDGAEAQLEREPYPLPRLETENFTSIFDWKYTDTKLIGYKSHPKIDFPLAV